MLNLANNKKLDFKTKVNTFYLSLLLTITNTSYICAQSDYVIIKSIQISELKKTKRTVVERELDFEIGDTIPLSELGFKIQKSEKRLQSSNLFNLAKINIKNWDTEARECGIEITLQENWYIYPYIILELADRNFDVWRKEQNYDIERLNYGVAMTHINFTGRKDVFKVKFQSGYTRKLELSYEFPYLWGDWGLNSNIHYSDNREIAYISENNKPLFYKNEDERRLLVTRRAHIGLLRRPHSKMFQSLRLEYNDLTTSDERIQELNPQYLGNNRKKIQYFFLDAVVRYDNTLYPLYPTEGVRWEANIRKEGLGIFKDINNTWLSLTTEVYYSLSKRLSFGHRLRLKAHLQSDPLPYFLNSGIGSIMNNLIGYQLYVLDGRDYILSQNNIRFKILDKDFKTFKFIPKQFKTMNAKVFLKASADIGYSNDPAFRNNNPLSNRPQVGIGPSIDVILFNNFSFSTVYGITQFGEKGLFFEGTINL